MIFNPNFTLQVDDRNATLHLAALPQALKTTLRSRIIGLSEILLAQVHAAEPHRTGKLRSLTHAFVREGKSFVRGGVTIDGTVGSPHNVAAAALEYGVHRVVHVRAHRARLSKIFGQATASQTVMIRAHPRRVDIAARRFLRGPAETMRPRAIAEIETAINEAITQTQRSS